MVISSATAHAYEDTKPVLQSPLYKTISAKAIQEQATISPINYDHVVVIGDLNLDGVDCKSIKIANSIIRGNVSFLGTTFTDDVAFDETTFLGKAEFNFSRFMGETYINSSHFDEGANFSEIVFIGSATFDYSTFDKMADFSADLYTISVSFYNCTFADDALFYLSQFKGTYSNFEYAHFLKSIDFSGCPCDAFISFSETKMDGYADFHSSRFAGGVKFINATFLGNSNFARCHFIEDSRFQNISFNNTTDFDSAKFDGPSFFGGTIFGKDILFNGAQFLAPADLTDVQFNGDLALNSSKISTMVLDRSNFGPESRLYLAKADINRFMVGWAMIKDKLSYDSSAYLSLVKNYKDMGMSDADDCYYQYRSVTQDMREWGWAKIVDMLANITCGYGVRADRPIYCSVVLIAFCSAILWGGKGLRKPTERYKNACLFDSLYYCLAIFFTIPLPDLKPVGNYKYVPVFLRAISWTLFALMIATLSKVMIK